jgi:hypothetical protein
VPQAMQEAGRGGRDCSWYLVRTGGERRYLREGEGQTQAWGGDQHGRPFRASIPAGARSIVAIVTRE